MTRGETLLYVIGRRTRLERFGEPFELYMESDAQLKRKLKRYCRKIPLSDSPEINDDLWMAVLRTAALTMNDWDRKEY